MRALAWIFPFAFLAALALPVAPADASHWCAETVVTVNPPFVPSGVTQIFAITLDNTGASNTTLTSVQVQFDWESRSQSLGGGPLNAGASRTFTVTSVPVPAGTHNVSVTFVGTNDADIPPSPVTCSRIRTVQTIGEGGNILAGLFTILLVLLGIAITVVVVIVVVAVVLTRKKTPPEPPQTPPPSPDRPSGSPEESPGGPHPGPPPSNP